MSDRPRFLVVGAGVIGASIAYHLALRDVEVIVCCEESALASPTASWASAGGLRFQNLVSASAALVVRSARRWPRLPDELEADIGLRLWGSLDFAMIDADLPRLQSQVASDRRLGLPVDILSRVDFPEVGALVSPDIIAGALAPGGGQADAKATTQAFLAAALRRGMRVVAAKAQTLIVSRDRAVGVATAQGELLADAVVVAAGYWSGLLVRSAGMELPLRPAGAHMLLTGALPPRLYPTVGALDRVLSVKQLPSGEIMIGGGWPATVEEDGRRCQVREESVDRNLANASAVVPWLTELQMARVWCGIDGETPDRLPLIGVCKEVSGLYLATGFSLGGFQVSPAVGELVADELVSGKSHSELAGLRPGRALPAGCGTVSAFQQSQRAIPER
jgi:sarcosine oxidase subunit beta